MNPIHILLVEDNEGDILLTKEAFGIGNIENKISVVRDGKEAMDFMTRSGKYCTVELPDLLLLDINLPKKNGYEVLQFLKSDNTLKHIPVIMLTTSSSKQDILKAYQHYANCYITKPVELDNFFEVAASIENFWISVVTLPHNQTA